MGTLMTLILADENELEFYQKIITITQIIMNQLLKFIHFIWRNTKI